MLMSQSVKDKSRNERKIRTGIVVNNRMKKTIIVQVVRLVKHPLYPRIVKRFSKFKAHDEDNTAKMGDWVKIMETRRFSKDKRWRLFSIVKHASTAPSLPEPASEQLASDLRAEK